jgi:NTP pyrophosphatase (non-canonical NTP hydrolase)
MYSTDILIRLVPKSGTLADMNRSNNPLSLADYQEKSRATAIYPDQGANFIYPTLGLVSEIGEVADVLKRVVRDENSILSTERRMAIGSEIGDILWYLSQLATELDLSIEDIATANLEKLTERKRAGTLRSRSARAIGAEPHR